MIGISTILMYSIFVQVFYSWDVSYLSIFENNWITALQHSSQPNIHGGNDPMLCVGRSAHSVGVSIGEQIAKPARILYDINYKEGAGHVHAETIL